jgi:DNA primase
MGEFMTNKSGCGGYVQAQAKTHQRAPHAASRRERACIPRTTAKDIKDSLQPWQIEAICKDWLPDGKKQGGWWVVKCPWREDKDPSLGVSLTTGRWQDFARGDHGDMMDLSMKLYGGTLAETIDGFAEMLGLRGA